MYKKYQHSASNKKDCNRKNIQLLYSSDSLEVPLERHSWRPVTEAENGISGAELLHADLVRSTGYISGETHDRCAKLECCKVAI